MEPDGGAMIINIRGTGGAGKSYLVRSIMALYETQTPAFIDGRKRPLCYTCARPGGKALFIPGHYETPTGGCDTLPTPDDVYTLVTLAAERGDDVLFEGIMVGDDVRRCAELNQKHHTLVIALNTSIDQCLAGIQQRRDLREDGRPLNPKNTVSRADRLKKSMVPRLRDAGVEVRWLSRDAAFEAVKQEFGFV